MMRQLVFTIDIKIGITLSSKSVRNSGGSPGLVVMGGDLCSKGREFESLHRKLDGHFFKYLFVVKFVTFA